MRPIKFRAWDNDLKVMLNSEDDISYEYKISFEGALWVDGVETSAVVMQFTGLLDINGKEIYEGDILHNGEYEYTVYFEDGAFVAINEYPTRYNGIFMECRIIGNIYEHSNLLK